MLTHARHVSVFSDDIAVRHRAPIGATRFSAEIPPYSAEQHPDAAEYVELEQQLEAIAKIPIARRYRRANNSVTPRMADAPILLHPPTAGIVRFSRLFRNSRMGVCFFCFPGEI